MESVLGAVGGAVSGARYLPGSVRIAALAMATVGEAGCSENHRVELSFGEDPAAFGCRDDAVPGGRDLALRATCVDSVTVVVDLIPLEGGVPACFSAEIKAWCMDEGCGPIEERRFYETVSRASLGWDSDWNLQDGIDAVLGALGGRLILREASGAPVIVRVVATAETEDEVRHHFPSFEGDHLLGCAISCPIELDEVQGTLRVDLPTLGNDCVDSICFCANGESRGEQCRYPAGETCDFAGES